MVESAINWAVENPNARPAAKFDEVLADYHSRWPQPGYRGWIG